MTLFLCIFLSVFFGSHYYVWSRVVRQTQLSPQLTGLLSLVLLAGAFGAPAGMLTQRLIAPDRMRPFLAMGLGWLGSFFFLFVATAVFHAVSTLMVWAIERTAPFMPERRLWFVRASAIASVAAATAMTLLSRRTVAAGFRLRQIPVTLSRLAPRLDGYRIAQISDLHVAPLLGRDYVDAVVDRVLALQPDCIVLTGDLVDGQVAHLANDIAPLGRLKAPDGVYMITGNHEYYSGVDAWLAHFRTLGIRPLRNERVVIGQNRGPLDLAGIDDWTAHQFGGDHGADLPRALAGRSESTPVVLLAHQPRAVDEAAQHGVDLVLSGHTHGGQLWPFGALVRLVQPYVKGLHRHTDTTQIYVHPGTGYWGPPMRLGAPAEVALLTLHASA